MNLFGAGSRNDLRETHSRCGARGGVAESTLLGSRLSVVLLGCLVLTSCAAPIDESWRSTPRLPYRTAAPPTTPPPLVHCNDRTGHSSGTTPWVFGGTCLCNPSISVLADYKASGILQTWAVATLEAYYRNRGITTLADHDDCNNLCRNGPHLLKGGRCLVPPTPGTINWEEVITGRFALPPWDFDRVSALGGPFRPEATPTSPDAAEIVPEELEIPDPGPSSDLDPKSE